MNGTTNESTNGTMSANTNGATNGVQTARQSTARLDGRVAIVTGAGKGIGAGIARELAARGASVVVSYRSSASAADALAEEINSTSSQSNGQALALQADVTSTDSIQSLFKQAKARFNHIDIVVSNSGVEHFAPIESVTPADFDAVFNTNTRGQFFVAQAAYEHLEPNGRLILMSSISAHNAIKQHAVYAGSKCAVEAFARCFAPDFGTRGITVNSIAPGGVKTDMAADVGFRYIPTADETWTMDDIEKFVSARTPMRRMALPVDIARVVGFLASEDAGWVSGKSFFRLTLFALAFAKIGIFSLGFQRWNWFGVFTLALPDYCLICPLLFWDKNARLTRAYVT